MYIVTMPTSTQEDRVHLRIRDDVKEEARAVARLRGVNAISALVKNLLVEEINREKAERPLLFAEALHNVQEEAKIQKGLKSKVSVTPKIANVTKKNAKPERAPQKGRAK